MKKAVEKDFGKGLEGFVKKFIEDDMKKNRYVSEMKLID